MYSHTTEPHPPLSVSLPSRFGWNSAAARSARSLTSQHTEAEQAASEHGPVPESGCSSVDGRDVKYSRGNFPTEALVKD
ncbi:hypothetical protein CRENBAI_015966 [Crenichthys baileyi]|uniref:Uncharacterized protein n=1 Tax=Crenichthys baileyi TaxID=28760 RepID=A0AAV9S4E6_9TELE